MKGAIILKGFIGLFLMISLPMWGLASGKPVCNIAFNHRAINPILSDTLPPPPAKITTDTKDKPNEGIIKVIPKARTQPVPVPVKVDIKPVKVIQPIIKPVIRVIR